METSNFKIIGSALGGVGVISIALLSLAASQPVETERLTSADTLDVKFTPAVPATTNLTGDTETSSIQNAKWQKQSFCTPYKDLVKGGIK